MLYKYKIKKKKEGTEQKKSVKKTFKKFTIYLLLLLSATNKKQKNWQNIKKTSIFHKPNTKRIAFLASLCAEYRCYIVFLVYY